MLSYIIFVSRLGACPQPRCTAATWHTTPKWRPGDALNDAPGVLCNPSPEGQGIARTCLELLTSKNRRLQREGRQSRRLGVEMKLDWLFDKPQSSYWLRVAASNLASQSPCLARVTHSHCHPQWDFQRFLGRLLGPEEGMETVLGQTGDFSWDQQTSSDFLRSKCAFPVRRAAWGRYVRNSNDS